MLSLGIALFSASWLAIGLSIAIDTKPSNYAGQLITTMMWGGSVLMLASGVEWLLRTLL